MLINTESFLLLILNVSLSQTVKIVAIFKSPFHVSHLAMTNVSANQSAQFIIQSHVILVGVFVVIFWSKILIIHNLSRVWFFDK